MKLLLSSGLLAQSLVTVRPKEIDAVFVPAHMPAGEYELAIGVLDPDTRKPKVKLAIAGADPEGWYPLGRTTIR